jgi:hypothetical protein
MRNLLLLLAMLVLALVAGCQSPSGSREYIPGQGWQDVR